MTPDKELGSAPRKPGRLSAAWQALRGAPVVPNQIRAEWTAWQFEFESLCDKLSAAAARLYQRDKKALDIALKKIEVLEAAIDDPCSDASGVVAAPGVPGVGWNPEKSAMNRLLLASRGIHIPQVNGGAHVDGVEAQQG